MGNPTWCHGVRSLENAALTAGPERIDEFPSAIEGSGFQGFRVEGVSSR